MRLHTPRLDCLPTLYWGLGSHCNNLTIEWSFCAPYQDQIINYLIICYFKYFTSRNSSMLSLPSLFLSIRLNILSVLFSGVASSSGSWTSVPIWTLKNTIISNNLSETDHFVYWCHYFHHFLPRYVAVTVEIIHTKYQGMVEFISIYKFKPTWTPILASGPVCPWR